MPGVLNTMVTFLWQYLRYWWTEFNILICLTLPPQHTPQLVINMLHNLDKFYFVMFCFLYFSLLYVLEVHFVLCMFMSNIAHERIIDIFHCANHPCLQFKLLVESHEVPWSTRNYHGHPMKYHGRQWTTMEVQRHWPCFVKWHLSFWPVTYCCPGPWSEMDWPWSITIVPQNNHDQPW